MNFSLAEISVRDVPVLQVFGEVEMRTADQLRTRLSGLLTADHPLVVVDLTEVTFFDSAGLHALDDCRKDAAERDAQFALVCPQNRVRRLFEITGLDARFVLHTTVDDAVGATGTVA